MDIHIDKERLAADFVLLCETDSPSREEGKIARLLKEMFAALGAEEIVEDDSKAATGSDSGNLLIRFAGNAALEPIFFNCHMDTVEPGRGVRVQREGNTFRSHGDTILGSDDKSGIAAILEAVRCVQEQNLAHRPLEVILTTCEEIGLLGAKNLNPSPIRARIGFALDSTGFGTVIIGAPAANRLEITVRGVAAHAGLHPEWGVNAIFLAAQALNDAPMGRIDEESTVNFGTIRGGTATNIIPDLVTINGEVRSHSRSTLDSLTRQIEDAFAKAVTEWSDSTGQAKGVPELTFTATPDFPPMRLTQNDPAIRLIDRAAASIGLTLEYKIAGGGSDANIFNGYGLQTAIVATGMNNVHSTAEQVKLQDMVDLTRLLVALMTN
jgi:tripeptide aminopeptidase